MSRGVLRCLECKIVCEGVARQPMALSKEILKRIVKTPILQDCQCFAISCWLLSGSKINFSSVLSPKKTFALRKGQGAGLDPNEQQKVWAPFEVTLSGQGRTGEWTKAWCPTRPDLLLVSAIVHMRSAERFVV